TDGEPLNVGRRTRSIPPALRRALQARDRGCRFPGCTHTRFVDAHHVQHWAQGGETRASNLVLLCRRHHRFVHEGGVQIQVLDDGAFRFVKPDGETLDSLPPQRPSAWTQLALQHEHAGLMVHAGTAVTRWGGESVDYGLAVGVLLAAAKRGSVPAATARGEEIPAEARHSLPPPPALSVAHAPMS
ncbi:MAG: HNH endonuclease, partial [Steroidobacteraceae bacterium]|nr:HNH endonuclease [Steroidobacteraceae bacterium]